MLAACSDFPKDPQATTQKAVGGVVRVGLSENPPWTDVDPEPGGVEVELIRRYAEAIGARAEWQYGAANDLLAKLEHFELDIVAAGLTADTPWKGRIATTLPYLTADTDGDGTRERHVLAVPPGENGWLVRLDKFLHTHQQEALLLLSEALQ